MANNNNNQFLWYTTLQIFGAKLILEVFGAVGAVWGFTEACGLRNASTVWFWRPCALSIVTLFFCRWILQIQRHMTSKKRRTVYEEQLNMSDDANVDDETN